jgi:hypothetical protein
MNLEVIAQLTVLALIVASGSLPLFIGSFHNCREAIII